MEKTNVALVRLSVTGAEPRESRDLLQIALEELGSEDAAFGRRLFENGVRFIVDAPFGTVHVPPADAKRLMEKLRDHKREATIEALPDELSSAERRNAAKAAFVLSLRQSAPA
jgi:hypothetical protein